MDTNDNAPPEKTFDEALAAKETALQVEADKRIQDGKGKAASDKDRTAEPHEHINPDG